MQRDESVVVATGILKLRLKTMFVQKNVFDDKISICKNTMQAIFDSYWFTQQSEKLFLENFGVSNLKFKDDLAKLMALCQIYGLEVVEDHNLESFLPEHMAVLSCKGAETSRVRIEI